MDRDAVLEQAKAILRGEHACDAPTMVETSQTLESSRALRWARLLLQRAATQVPPDEPLRRTIAHRLARCTYKDPDLPAQDRLDEAERILGEADDLVRTRDHETLGLAGAIQKRKWEVYAQKQYLERALAYYRRGYEAGPEHDAGYTGINAAFVLDALAHEEEQQAARSGATSDTAAARRAQASRIREDLLSLLSGWTDEKHDYWSLVTAAEACFGLLRYGEAKDWLQRAREHADRAGVAGWQRETTARQLANLYRMHQQSVATAEDFAATEAADALHALLDNLPAVLGAYRGKLGLALSGGGFRAALFHIGVLARLAERDVLRHVEVLSCVSGGSIIGAHYYLELRTLLETKPDHLIDRQDYIDIVRRIERDFLEGVQANVRMRMVGSFLHNVRMLFRRDYSRTHRIGELYERHIYSRIADANGRTPRWLNGLFVRPHGERTDFHPSFDNWRRSAKVPMLVLNATSLNTGHAWQFTASWMGEPPTTIDSEIDSNDRYRRMYYRDAPEPYRSFRLGHAVAASSCVPGLFEPLPLVDLYPERAVRLVDGGVHDNQGIASLLEQNCDGIMISDASGQMSSENMPGDGLLAVPLRTNDILMARVREAQYRELAARRRSSMLRGLLFLHLKKDLELHAVDWIGCDEPPASFDSVGETTVYGIRRDVQAALAAVRTDLDSFSDMEAYALMLSGYRMTAHQFGQCLPEFDGAAGGAERWRFQDVEGWAASPQKDPAARRFDRVLRVARNRALKIWRLAPALNAAGIILLGALALAALLFLWSNRAETAVTVTWGDVLEKIVPLALGAILGGTAVKMLRARSSLMQYLVTLGFALAGWLIAFVHLAVFDRLYLRYGRVQPGAGARPATPQMTEGVHAPAPARRMRPREDEQMTSSAPPPAEPPGEKVAAQEPPTDQEPEPVLLGASAPRAVRAGDEFTARFVAYIRSVETEVKRTLEGLSPGSAVHLGVQSCRWTPGTRVTVRIAANHIAFDPAEETFEWSGERNLIEFDARVSDNAPAGTTVLKYDVLIDGIRVARLRVDLEIATQSDASTRATIGEPARTAFASYASEDRLRVLDRVASVRTAAGLDVFLDCLSMNPGDLWKPRLESEIQERDLFLLFWSAHAGKSKWVEWEWRTALSRRGLEDIEPHPLDPVQDAPPPPELADLHFGDPLVIMRAAYEQRETERD